MGEMTMLLRLKTPVNSANTVASMFKGVIFAKRTSTGIWLQAVDKVSVRILENTTNLYLLHLVIFV